MTFDAGNALFEFGMAGLLALNIRQILRDKRVQGVNLWTEGFFALWAVWNLIYYPHLDQWWSVAGAACMFVAKATWVVLAIRYSRAQPQAGAA